MSLEYFFQKWLQDGCREEKRQERDTNLPNAISSDDWNNLLAHATSKTLPEQLEGDINKLQSSLPRLKMLEVDTQKPRWDDGISSAEAFQDIMLKHT